MSVVFAIAGMSGSLQVPSAPCTVGSIGNRGCGAIAEPLRPAARLRKRPQVYLLGFRSSRNDHSPWVSVLRAGHEPAAATFADVVAREALDRGAPSGSRTRRGCRRPPGRPRRRARRAPAVAQQARRRPLVALDVAVEPRGRVPADEVDPAQRRAERGVRDVGGLVVRAAADVDLHRVDARGLVRVERGVLGLRVGVARERRRRQAVVVGDAERGDARLQAARRRAQVVPGDDRVDALVGGADLGDGRGAERVAGDADARGVDDLRAAGCTARRSPPRRGGPAWPWPRFEPSTRAARTAAPASRAGSRAPPRCPRRSSAPAGRARRAAGWRRRRACPSAPGPAGPTSGRCSRAGRASAPRASRAPRAPGPSRW